MSGLGAAMAGGNPGHLATEARDRAKDDFYATPRAVTESLAQRYRADIATRILWEPCAGNGVMADVLRPYVEFPEAGGKIVATDINPRRADVAAMDIFDPRINDATAFRQAVECVVTNPPFALAPPIIERILAPGFLPKLRFFALVLKSTFWHAKRRASLFEQFPPYAIHPLLWRPDFHDLGAPTMECMWCVWQPWYGPGPTMYLPMKEPVLP